MAWWLKEQSRVLALALIITLAVHFSDQISPGSFERTLNCLVDNELNLSFNSRYNNDFYRFQCL